MHSIVSHKMIKSCSDLSVNGEKIEIDHFYECLDIEVVKVNPETCELEYKKRIIIFKYKNRSMA